MDCPDRERAQWTGDAVNESGEAFYILSRSSDQLSKKWLNEFINWQRKDGSIYAPTPAGNYDSELPAQILATVGYYGVWNYYLNSGDKKTLTHMYPGIKRYLALWEWDGKGTVKLRKGGWDWGDWGENIDMLSLYNLWYYLAIKGQYLTAKELGYRDDAKRYELQLKNFKIAFNKNFWHAQANAYRNPLYNGKTDDRTQALAVISGIADIEKFPSILKTFQAEEHASPYMEKYVYEAMMMMGYEKEALARHKKRFAEMVNDTRFTTLFEGWGIGSEGYGGGTVNHAWSGGGATIAAQYVCGVAPITPGYSRFQIKPQPGDISEAKLQFQSVKGTIASSFKKSSQEFQLSFQIPSQTNAVVCLPKGNYREVILNGVKVWKDGKFIANGLTQPDYSNPGQIGFIVAPGSYEAKGVY
jgi:hypothetical protein